MSLPINLSKVNKNSPKIFYSRFLLCFSIQIKDLIPFAGFTHFSKEFSESSWKQTQTFHTPTHPSPHHLSVKWSSCVWCWWGSWAAQRQKVRRLGLCRHLRRWCWHRWHSCSSSRRSETPWERVLGGCH